MRNNNNNSNSNSNNNSNGNSNNNSNNYNNSNNNNSTHGRQCRFGGHTNTQPQGHQQLVNCQWQEVMRIVESAYCNQIAGKYGEVCEGWAKGLRYASYILKMMIIIIYYNNNNNNNNIPYSNSSNKR